MSKVVSDIIRVKDRLLIKLAIYLERTHAEWNYLEFRRENSILDILSTTEGFIQNNRIVLKKQKSRLEICIDYSDKPFDCIIAYLDSDNLMKHETVHIEPEIFKPIQPFGQEAIVVETGERLFSDKLQELHKTLTTRRSLWHLRISLERDLKVSVLRSGKSSINVAFGSSGDDVVIGDFIFSIDPDTKNFVIPVELVWMNSKLYPRHARLAIFELVQADFHRVPNMFYKSPISNSVVYSDCDKIETGSLEAFTSPLGLVFTPDQWRCDYNLPIWRGNG